MTVRTNELSVFRPVVVVISVLVIHIHLTLVLWDKTAAGAFEH